MFVQLSFELSKTGRTQLLTERAELINSKTVTSSIQVDYDGFHHGKMIDPAGFLFLMKNISRALVTC